MDIHLMRHSTLKVIDNCVKHEIAHAVLPYGQGHGMSLKSIYKHLAGNLSKAQEKHFFFYKFKCLLDKGTAQSIMINLKNADNMVLLALTNCIG